MNPSHSKFHGLAERVHHHRLRQSQGATSIFTGRHSLASSHHGEQIAFCFDSTPQKLEIFHHFDSERREVEWSYYSDRGDFLLQFGFDLQSKSYLVHVAHPGLFLEDTEESTYLQVIQAHLHRHHPSLILSHENNGQILLRRQQNHCH